MADLPVKYCRSGKHLSRNVPVIPQKLSKAEFLFMSVPKTAGEAFCIFCGIVVSLVGVGGRVATAADGYVSEAAVDLVRIPLAGLCFSSTSLD